MKYKEGILLSPVTKEDIKRNYKFVGSGVDGSVYRVNKDFVYKFYNENSDRITAFENGVYDEDGVNVADYKNLRDKGKRVDNRALKYIDEDGVILAREEAIIKAMEKQKYVKNTQLPIDIIYVNYRVAGCVYKYYPNKLGIYSAAYLPLSIRLKICKRLLEKVKELVDNNIYPIALAQVDHLFPISKKNANVLLGVDLEPQIIDLDGISTIYSDKHSDTNLRVVETNLTLLILEIISRLKINYNEIDDFNYESYAQEMIKNGIPMTIVDEFFDYFRVDIDSLNHTISYMQRSLRK